MKRLGLIGPGRVGRSLLHAIPPDRYALGPVMGKGPTSAKRLVRELHAGRVVQSVGAFHDCDLILLAIPESEVEPFVQQALRADVNWRRKTILHTCRECCSELMELGSLGASVAALYPVYPFRRLNLPLQGVQFMISGMPPAIREARAVVRSIQARSRVAAHEERLQAVVASSIASEVFAGLVELGIRRLMAAGLSRRSAFDSLQPLLSSTLENRRRAGLRTRPIEAQDAPVLHRLAEACDRNDRRDGALYRGALGIALESLEVNDAELRRVAVTGSRLPERPVVTD